MATKKTAKKASAKKSINKSAEIRAFLAANPNMKLADAAAALTKKGIKVNAQYISVVKSAAKKKAGNKQVAKKPGRPAKTVSKSTSTEISLDTLLLVKKLIKEVGGVKEARRAIEAFEQLLD